MLVAFSLFFIIELKINDRLMDKGNWIFFLSELVSSLRQTASCKGMPFILVFTFKATDIVWINRVSSTEAFLQVWNGAILKATKRLLQGLLNKLTIRSLGRKDSNCETKMREEVFARELNWLYYMREKKEAGDLLSVGHKRERNIMSW